MAFITRHPQFLRFKGTEHAYLQDDFSDRSKYHGDYDFSERKDFKADKKYEAKQIDTEPHKKDFVGRRVVEAPKMIEARHRKKDFVAKMAIEAPAMISTRDKKKDFVAKRAVEAPKTIEAKMPRKKEFKAPKQLYVPDPISAKGPKKKEFKAARSYEAKTIKIREQNRWSDDEGEEDKVYSDGSGSDSEPSKRRQRRKHGNRWSDDEAEDTRKAYHSDNDSELESDSGVERSDCERGVNPSKKGVGRLRIEYADERPGSKRHAPDSISSEEDSDSSDDDTFDPYEALGVRKGDTTAFIDSIRKKLLSKYHPDKFGGKASERDVTRAQRRTQEINRAWDILGDASRRKACDKYGIIENNDLDEEMAVMRLSHRKKAESKPKSQPKAKERTEFSARNVGTNKSALSKNSKKDAEKEKTSGSPWDMRRSSKASTSTHRLNNDRG